MKISDDRVSYLTNAEALAHLHDVRQRYEPLPGYKTQTEAEAEEIKARGPLTSQQRSAVKKPIFHDLKTGLGEVLDYLESTTALNAAAFPPISTPIDAPTASIIPLSPPKPKSKPARQHVRFAHPPTSTATLKHPPKRKAPLNDASPLPQKRRNTTHPPAAKASHPPPESAAPIRPQFPADTSFIPTFLGRLNREFPRLSKAEKMQILNLRPTSADVLDVVVEDLEVRFGEGGRGRLEGFCRRWFGGGAEGT